MSDGRAPADEVRREHEARANAAAEDAARESRADLRIADARTWVFFAALALLVAVWVVPGVSAWWLLTPPAALGALVVVHLRVAKRLARAERRGAFHRAALARMDGTWAGTGQGGERFASPEHPYSGHLDVFGRGSLFELLSAARTPQGEALLAAWLQSAPDAEEIRARQEAVRELAPRLDLREDIALLGGDAAAAPGLAEVGAWGAREPVRAAAWVAPATLVLPVLVLTLTVLWLAGTLPVWPLVAAVLVVRLLARATAAATERMTAGVVRASADLDLLAALLARLEAETPRAPLLVELRERLGRGRDGAAARIAALRRVVATGETLHSQFAAPIVLALFGDVALALAFERWRRRDGPRLAGWIDAVARFEALASLAGHAAEHPDDPFPEIVDEGPLLAAEGLAHPLLTEARGVRNDVALDATRRVYVVSGSNMSGKSTLLRAVGSNAVLAFAGGTVRARRLRIAPLTLGASIHVHDSLQDGESRFYAEVARVAAIVRLGRDPARPLLFLLDELFHGTNSSDRRTGAAAVVRALLEGGAVGLVTTHDLELARLAEDLGAGVVNVHFEDQFDDGRMSFDYRMRPGVVTRSNALALMRAVGLDV